MVDDRKLRLTSVPLKQRTYLSARRNFGIVLGPLIFIVFINDVDITLFADDMTIGCLSAYIENLYLRMNLILDLFKKWFTANKLTVNNNKTKYIVFHRTYKPVTDSLLSLYLNSVSMEKVASTRFLGVVIDVCLSWKLHISNVSVIILKFISIFYRERKTLTHEAFVMLYNSLVYPHLTYCKNVLCSGPKTKIGKLFIQKNVRVITFSKFNPTNLPPRWSCCNLPAVVFFNSYYKKLNST